MSETNQRPRLATWMTIGVGLLWFCTGAALSSRTQLVFSYDTLVSTPPAFEILAATNTALLFLLVVLSAFVLASLLWNLEASYSWKRSVAWFACACAPLLLLVGRCFNEQLLEPMFWEPVWFASFSGLAFFWSLRAIKQPVHVPVAVMHVGLALSVLLVIGWLTWQTEIYYRNFQLGFNDFGHFTQRIANTANGRGFLLESPVLPTFWDHFNPGLALLAPVWKVWPDVRWIFILQAICLASPAWLIASIARRLGASSVAAVLWGLAWLLHPSVSQMNLAYTYGWHPISLAIPLLLLAGWLLLAGRFKSSIIVALLACSFEEGVIVVIGCFAAAMFLRSWLRRKSSLEQTKQSNPPVSVSGQQPAVDFDSLVTWQTWCFTFVVAVVSFVLVYRFSGLAEFQTARFAKLGDSAWQIIASPIINPGAFWGLLLRPRNLAFLLFVLTPVFVPSLFKNFWALLAVALPFGVLLVWDHLPAQSIAFQYASCLLPILFVGSIQGALVIGSQLNVKLARRDNSGSTVESDDSWEVSDQGLPAAGAAAMTGLVLSLFVGQMPWSQSTIIELAAKTYGLTEVPLRQHDQPDGQWLLAETDKLRGESLRVLATGRIASHLVGSADLETVGQYFQRYKQLQKLDEKTASPILRYDAIVLDFKESFQQSREESLRVKEEALQHGFSVQMAQHDIEILRRTTGK